MISYCSKDCEEVYPYYGLAPHKHDLSSGSFIGSTRTLDKSQWPNNFKEDEAEPGMGVWYCPDCLKGKSDEQ